MDKEIMSWITLCDGNCFNMAQVVRVQWGKDADSERYANVYGEHWLAVIVDQDAIEQLETWLFDRGQVMDTEKPDEFAGKGKFLGCAQPIDSFINDLNALIKKHGLAFSGRALFVCPIESEWEYYSAYDLPSGPVLKIRQVVSTMARFRADE